MEILNKSHRYSLYSKVSNSIVDPTSFSFQSSRRQAYSQRLYFEYLYTQKVNGTTFFYTLTYNDKKIPKYTYYGGTNYFNCFSYDDIRIVTNGALSKILERKYGSKLKFFCSCETGEGKGQRGAGNNTHYHFIFFVQPLNDSYKVIQPLEFRKLIRKIWQGFDQNEHKVPFQDARFGIAKEGDNCGLVRNAAPFKYVSKYVLKDNNELDKERIVYDYWIDYYKQKFIDFEVLWYYYKYNSELVGSELHNLYEWFGLDHYQKYRKTTTDSDKSYWQWLRRYAPLDHKVNAVNINDFFTDSFLPMMAKIKVREYINMYSGKPRCSKSLGEYGLQFIKNVDSSPLLNIPNAHGFDCQNPCLYYYRKLYYEKYKCDVTGNVLYRLNELGVQMKCNSLQQRILSLSTRVNESLSVVHNTHIHDFYRNYFKHYSKNPLIMSLVRSENKDSLIRYFSIYKLVYQFRCYFKDDFIALDPQFSFDYVLKDYERFIKSDSYFYDYDIFCIRQKLWHHHVKDDSVRTFESHPCLSKYVVLFKVLDDMLNDVSRYRSDYSKRLFEDNRERAQTINAHLNSIT